MARPRPRSISLPTRTFQSSQLNQSDPSSGICHPFPDDVSHLDIELSCLEDHPSCMSFADGETVSQSRSRLLHAGTKYSPEAIEEWNQSTPPGADPELVAQVWQLHTSTPKLHGDSAASATRSKKLDRHPIRRGGPKRLSPIPSIATTTSSMHGSVQSGTKKGPPVPPKDIPATQKSNHFGLAIYGIYSSTSATNLKTKTGKAKPAIQGTISSDQSTPRTRLEYHTKRADNKLVSFQTLPDRSSKLAFLKHFFGFLANLIQCSRD